MKLRNAFNRCRNFSNGSASNDVKRILIRASIAVITFALGIVSAAISIKQPKSTTPAGDCVPRYDENVIAKSLREIDDPQFFMARSG